MVLRGDSYGSVAEVEAMTRRFLRGETAYNSTTTPTVTEVEKFIDRASASLNAALRVRGISTPVTDAMSSTAVLDLDGWVVGKASLFVEMTLRGAGSRSQEGPDRFSSIRNLSNGAKKFVNMNSLGWIRLGVTEGARLSDGLQFTGLGKQADRIDPDDTSLEQPKFKRGQFDSP